MKKAVAEHGLWYPPDPSSFEICSIGGNIATNAGGLCCVKYGVTTDYVLGLQVVLADGTAVRLGGPRLKDVAGLSLTKLFVGSEGTLGVDHRGDAAAAAAAARREHGGRHFDSVEAAATAVVTITGKIRPSMLEFMDSGGDQRRRGQAEDGPGPKRRRDDGRRDRRPRTVRRRGRRVHGRGVHRTRCEGSVFHRRPRRGRGVRGRAPVRDSRGRGQGLAAARGCRRAAARAGRSGRAASRRSPRTTT